MITTSLKSNSFEDLFENYKINKLTHFYPSLFIKNEKLIGSNLKNEDILTYFKFNHKDDLVYNAIYKLTINKYKGYIWGNFNNKKIFIYLSIFHNNKFVDNFLIANYDYLESAFEKNINSLLTIKNNQIIINIIENLIDFEIETESAKNISGTKKYTYLVKKDKVTFSENIKFEIILKK